MKALWKRSPSRFALSVAITVAFTAMTLVASGCIFTSRSPLGDPVARSPLGVHGEVRVGADRYVGELLAITQADFVLLTDRRVVVIPFTVAGVGDFGSIDVNTFGVPWWNNAQQLQFASRYPYGIPTEALAAILRQRGQTAPDTARYTGR